MTRPTDDAFLVHVAAGIVAVLVVATIAGWLLKSRIAHGQPHAVIDNVNARIGAWWIIAAVFGAAASQGATGLAFLFAIASLQALNEFMQDRPRPALPWVVLIVLTLTQYLLAVLEPPRAFTLLGPTVAILAFAARAMPQPLSPTWQELPAASLLCVYGIAHIPAIAALDRHHALGMAVFLVVVTQASDVVQYLAGKLLGRRLLAPRLSPGKTVEGALGGIAGASLLGAVLSPLTPYGLGTSASIAALLTTLGIAGGLVLSAQKRRRGIKDWSTVIPGHGGVLDRLDSLCLSAPACYHLLRIFPGD